MHVEHELRGGLDELPLKISQDFIRSHLPALDPDEIVLHMRCFYQNVEDNRFIIGPHPEDEDITVCCGFSGEGFKHAPIIGSFVAHSLLHGEGGAEAEAAHAGLFARMQHEFRPSRFFGV